MKDKLVKSRIRAYRCSLMIQQDNNTINQIFIKENYFGPNYIKDKMDHEIHKFSVHHNLDGLMISPSNQNPKHKVTNSGR